MQSEVMWIAKDADVPDGWRLVPATVLCHHHHWSKLVEKIDDAEGTDRRGDTLRG